MLDIDRESTLWQALQSETAIEYYLIEFDYADSALAKEYYTTKSGNITIGDVTYVPYEIPVAVNPPKPTNTAADQLLFTLDLAPRDEEEMRLEKDKWSGRLYPQVWTRAQSGTVGIKVTIKVCFEVGETTEIVAREIFNRDSSVEVYPNPSTNPVDNTCDIIQAWLNLPDARPFPLVAIAPEPLPAGLFTATAGSNTAATENTYFQFMRYGSLLRGGHNFFIELGTDFDYNNDFDAYHAAASSRNRWFTADAEQRYAVRILNRRTRESHDIPISSMTRGAGHTTSNYYVNRPDLEDFFLSMPSRLDASLPESFRAYGARVFLVDNTEVATNVTAPMTLYQGKLHNVTQARSEAGYILSIGFSSIFAKQNNSYSRSMTQDDQEAAAPGDSAFKHTANLSRALWGRKL